MIPSTFVTLDALPLTANGKINRKLLPAPETLRSEEANFVEPRTETEKMLVEIWREVLELPRIDVRDNFFDLGGHSLLSLRVLSEIERRTGVRLSPREMIFHTLEQSARTLESVTNPSSD
jgi:acyl carrier protein